MRMFLFAAFLLLFEQKIYGDIIIAQENFDGGAVNLVSTQNVVNYTLQSTGDVFARVSRSDGGLGTGGPFDVWDDSVVGNSGGAPFPTDTLGIAGQNSSAFFAMNDPDGLNAFGNNNNAVWSFDVSSAPSLTTIKIDIAAMGDFEASSSDGFLIEARLDGGQWLKIFQGITDESASKDYRALDAGTVVTLNDPLELFIDEVATGIFLDKADSLTGKFDTFASSRFAGLSGSLLDIRLSWAGSPSGSEPMGFDNITVNAVPEPSAAGLLALTGIAGMAFRRRRS